MLGEVKGLHMLHSARGKPMAECGRSRCGLGQQVDASAHMGDVLNSDSGAKEYLESGDYPELSSIL